MKKNYQFSSRSVDDLDEIADRLLKAFPDHRIFAFYGEMGAGKTTIIKSLCQVLNVEDSVSSPTFAIVNVYQTADGSYINHFDCYRMKSIEEAFDIGYEDYFFSGDYCFVEWPEKIEILLPEEAVRVEIIIDKESGQRNISCSA